MSRRRHPSDQIRPGHDPAEEAVRSRPSVPSSAPNLDVRLRSVRRRPWLPWVGLAGLLLAGVALVYLTGGGWNVAGAITEEERLCREFAELKNKRIGKANELLAPAPEVPNHPVSEEEAERLFAAFLLHNGDLQVKVVQPEASSSALTANGRMVLVLKGDYLSEPLLVETANGVDPRQRVARDPTVVVEVNDGKIRGVKVAAWKANPAPLTPEEELCGRFAVLRNAGDPTAEGLLAAAPPLPRGPVSDEEAARLDAQYILRNPFRVLAVRPERPARGGAPARFVLVTKGGCASEPLPNRGQRILMNPDVVVEVRDGKIHALEAGLHRE